MRKSGQKRIKVSKKKSTEKKIPTRKYMMEAPSMIGYPSGDSKSCYAMLPPPAQANVFNTGNGGYIQLHTPMPMTGKLPTSGSGGYSPMSSPAMMPPKPMNGSVGLTHGIPASPLVQKHMSQPQMNYSQMGGYGSSPFSGGQDPLQHVMHSSSTPTLMHQQQSAMPQIGSPAAPSSQQGQLSPPDKMGNGAMPSFADQMNAAYAAYEQQQNIYDQQQQDLLKQLYVSHPYPLAAMPDGGSGMPLQHFGGPYNKGAAPYGNSNPHHQFSNQYQSGVGAFKGGIQRASAFGGAANGGNNMYGGGSNKGSSSDRSSYPTQYNAPGGMPKTIPPRNGLGDVSSYHRGGYNCFNIS